MIVLAFVVVAAVGTAARVAIGVGLNREHFPLDTLLVNVIGAFALGLLAGTASSSVTVFGTGALGSFTTFSTFSYESMYLCRRQQIARSAFYITISIVAGVGAAWIGLALSE